MAHQLGKRIPRSTRTDRMGHGTVRRGDGFAGTCDGHGTDAKLKEMLKRGKFMCQR